MAPPPAPDAVHFFVNEPCTDPAEAAFHGTHPSGSAAMKRRREDGEWELLFPNPAPLISIVHAISNLSTTLHLHVDGEGIRTQAVSSSKSCMVAARLACQVSGIESTTVCIDSTTLLRALRAVSHTQCVWLRGKTDDADKIRLAAADEITRACTIHWDLPLLADDCFEVALDALDYTGEWVYDTSALKNDLRRCMDMDGNDIVTLILLQNGQGGSCVRLTATGDRGGVTLEHHSTAEAPEAAEPPTLDQDGPDELAESPAQAVDQDGAIELAEPAEPLKTVFTQQYAISNLVRFLKSVELPTVKLLLGSEQPLIVEVGLNGGDGSNMTFVQGPYAGD